VQHHNTTDLSPPSALARSAALGIKMNALLFAPAFAVVYLRSLGLARAFQQGLLVLLIQVCHVPALFLRFSILHLLCTSLIPHPSLLRARARQVLISLPFTLHHPSAYFHGAFDFNRAFLYKWTVNLRLLPEATFLSPRTARLLLAGHGLGVAAWMTRWLYVPGAATVLEKVKGLLKGGEELSARCMSSPGHPSLRLLVQADSPFRSQSFFSHSSRPTCSA